MGTGGRKGIVKDAVVVVLRVGVMNDVAPNGVEITLSYSFLQKLERSLFEVIDIDKKCIYSYRFKRYFSRVRSIKPSNTSFRSRHQKSPHVKEIPMPRTICRVGTGMPLRLLFRHAVGDKLLGKLHHRWLSNVLMQQAFLGSRTFEKSVFAAASTESLGLLRFFRRHA